MLSSCQDVRPLLPGYLDGELSEAQAAPLRSHLMDCVACRESVQEGKVLQRWFRAGREGEVTVPQGFSARVARRAFAGDSGLLQPAPAADVSEAGHSSAQPSGSGELLPFLLKLTALAAGLLFTLSLVIQNQSLPASGDVDALEYKAPWVDDIEAPLERLPVSAPQAAGEDEAGLDEEDEDGEEPGADQR